MTLYHKKFVFSIFLFIISMYYASKKWFNKNTENNTTLIKNKEGEIMEITNKQHWHMEPPCGLLNDPNGLSWFIDKYYVFFQWNRFGKNHKNKEWGFFTSPDLVNWSFQGSALLPDQPYDENGVYSGSAYVVNGDLYIYYTGNNKQNGIRTSSQCLAVTTDGMRFIKHGPIFSTPKGYTQHFRDPRIIPGKNGNYLMLIGAQRNNGKGGIVLLNSKDGKIWEMNGLLAKTEEWQMIECPDYFEIDNTGILLYCPQHRDNTADKVIDSVALFKKTKLQEDTPKLEDSDLDNRYQKVDKGFDFYSPQTMKTPDGRRVLIGWMSRMDEAQEEIFSRNEPRIHCLTMPREILLENGHLIQRPVKELYKLLGNKIHGNIYSERIVFQNISRSFHLTVISKNFLKDKQIKIHCNEWRFEYDSENKIGLFARNSWVSDSEEIRLFKLDTFEAIEIWSDNSSIEIFINGGQDVFTSRIFPKKDSVSVCIENVDSYSSVQLNELLTV